MAESVFDDKSREPTLLELEEALGVTSTLLKALEQHLEDRFGVITREWRFYGKQAGWTLALAHKGRRVFHLIPRPNRFTVVITLGSRAVLACEGSDLPGQVLSAIHDAREYAEGRSIRLEIAAAEDLVAVKQLIAIKLAH
jgi:hypothetical protein